MPAKVVGILTMVLHGWCPLLFLLTWQSAALSLQRINLFDGLMCRTCDFSDGVVSTSAKLVRCWEMKAKICWSRAGPLMFPPSRPHELNSFLPLWLAWPLSENAQLMSCICSMVKWYFCLFHADEASWIGAPVRNSGEAGYEKYLSSGGADWTLRECERSERNGLCQNSHANGR